MTSVREQCLLTLFTKLQTLQTSTRSVFRNRTEVTDVPADGVVILNDGVPGEPEVLLSPTLYIYDHTAELLVIVKDRDENDRSTLLDDLLLLINGVILANVELEGYAEYLRAEAPDVSTDYLEGGIPIKYATVPILIRYHTTSPLA